MDVKTLIPVFGGNRSNASLPAKLMGPVEWLGIPFVGGFSEVPHFKARTIVCNDLNRHAINLATVVRDRCDELMDKLNKTIFHIGQLRTSQQACIELDHGLVVDYQGQLAFEWAYHYFIASWMTRSGSAGSDGEFQANLSVRWEAGGGDSVVRFRNATEGLKEWQTVLKKATFVASDAFEFIRKVKDRKGIAIYADPPWPADGENYRHKFTPAMHEALADMLRMFKETRVVVRYGAHPLIEELYRDGWTWNDVDGRTQANKVKREVLLTNFKP